MKQMAYVDANGNAIEVNPDPKKMLIKAGIIVGAILMIIIIIVSIIKSGKNKVCNALENKAIEAAYKYASDNELLPIVGGKSVVIDLEDL